MDWSVNVSVGETSSWSTSFAVHHVYEYYLSKTYTYFIIERDSERTPKKTTCSLPALQENQNSLLRGEAVEAEAFIRFETQKDCRLVIIARPKPNDVKKLYCWRHGETVKLAAQKFARCEAWAYKNKRVISVISETWAAAFANCNLHFWRGGKGKGGVMTGFFKLLFVLLIPANSILAAFM